MGALCLTAEKGLLYRGKKRFTSSNLREEGIARTGMNAGVITTHPEAPTPIPRKKRVLLLDDDVDFCAVLRAVIEWHGHYELTVVHRGAEGVREIMAGDFDAIICDMVMPGMPGEMFYVAVQRLKPHLCKRFIFITAHRNDPAVGQFFALVGCKALYKPLDTDELIAALVEVIDETAKDNERATGDA